MILRSKSISGHQAVSDGAGRDAPDVAVPGWLRRAVAEPQRLAGQDVALAAGAALSALDAAVRRHERWAGAWRQRLALAAAAATARQAGRVEDEAALRDAVLLTRSGDDVGPAGRMFLGWSRLAGRPTEDLLTEASIAGVFDALGLVRDDETVADLSDELRHLAATEGTVGTLVGAFAAVERRGLSRAVGCWAADALLAQRLGWTHAVPLFGGEAAGGNGSVRRQSAATVIAPKGIEADPERAKTLLAAQARAALRAVDLSAELGRRAERLLAVAPKLRAKAADTVVGRLLNEDAFAASRGDKKTGMSDRGLRRLFDRLVELGAVRELSGRPTFRIYGL